MKDYIKVSVPAVPRKRGAQLGNHNARKHGFYSRTLTGDQKLALKEALSVHGLDEEIAMLRIKLLSVSQDSPENVRLYLQGVNSLARLLRIRQALSKDQPQDFDQGLYNVLTQIGGPLGVDLVSLLKQKLEARESSST